MVLWRIRGSGNGIDIYETPLLKNLIGLEGLVEIPGDLTITANNLESLAGLENLQAIGLDLVISQDTGLTSLFGLRKLIIYQMMYETRFEFRWRYYFCVNPLHLGSAYSIY